MKLLNFLLLFVLFFFMSNCFEYEEVITFRKNFSGLIEISYTVPLKSNNEESLIKFLPITEEQIQQKLNKGLFSKNIQIKDYSFKLIPKKENDPSPFKNKGKVSYRIDFTEPSQLDGIVLGSLYVRKKANTLTIKREFKTINKPIDQNSTTGEKKVHSETMKLLGSGSILFRVLVPQNSEIKSTRGDTTNGALNFKVPLTDTMEKSGLITWSYTIIAY